ncbi:Rh228 [macacine betaherpesvirus 3]|nr:Rh228 [macacine betaherpesvirus 3]
MWHAITVHTPSGVASAARAVNNALSDLVCRISMLCARRRRRAVTQETATAGSSEARQAEQKQEQPQTSSSTSFLGRALVLVGQQLLAANQAGCPPPAWLWK